MLAISIVACVVTSTVFWVTVILCLYRGPPELGSGRCARPTPERGAGCGCVPLVAELRLLGTGHLSRQVGVARQARFALHAVRLLADGVLEHRALERVGGGDLATGRLGDRVVDC